MKTATIKTIFKKGIEEDKKTLYTRLKNTNVKDWEDVKRFKNLLKEVFNINIDLRTLKKEEHKKQFLKAEIKEQLNKELQRKMADVKDILNNDYDLQSIEFYTKWNKSRTWGLNPRSQASIIFKGFSRYTESGAVSGCGYDKASTALNHCINNCEELRKFILKRVIKKVDDNLNNKPYGIYISSSGIYISCNGCGVSTIRNLFEFIGYDFKEYGSSYDFIHITKKQ